MYPSVCIHTNSEIHLYVCFTHLWHFTECLVNFGDVAGRCYVVFSENLTMSICEWTTDGPDRFYFSQAYNSNKQEFVDPPADAVVIGFQGKVSCRLSQCN